MEGLNKTGLEEFNKPRQPTDINLNDKVRSLLVAHKVPKKVIDEYDNHRFIEHTNDKASNVQKVNQNRYWMIVLMSIPQTQDTRKYLINDGTVEKWLEYFEGNIIPVIRQYNQ